MVWAALAFIGLTLECQPGMAQSGTSHPPVISTSTQWTLDAPMLASADANGAPGNGFSKQANFSPDGTHLLFWFRSTNIVSGATNSFQQLYLKDLITGAVSVVSSDVHGAEGNNDSSNPANSGQILMFSPDGRKALFESAADNLGPAGTNGLEQIFIKDLTTGSVTLVSTDGHGVPGNANSMDFTFSPDGTKVAFDSISTNLVPGGTTGQQVFVKDWPSGAVTLVSADGSGAIASGSSSFPVFSPDGTEVAFASTSTNLAAGTTNGKSEIYIKNLVTGAVTLASADASGNEANDDSFYPMFSPDGSKLAFNSVSSNLAPGLRSANSQAYVKDLVSGAVTLVSADASGVAANGSSMLGAFSPDSTKIAFQSAASNLLPGENGANQVIVKDLLTGEVTLASTSATGVQGNSDSLAPTFAPSHTALAFQSGSTNFGVNNFTSQVYVRAIFTAAGAVVDHPFVTTLTTAGRLEFSDADTADTHTASVTAQAGDLGTVTASVSKDSTGTGTGGAVLWNYQVAESQLSAQTAPLTDNFTLTLTDSQGCIATTSIVVTALPRDFAVTNGSNGSTSSSSTSISSCPELTNTALLSSKNPSVLGQAVTFSVVVSSTATTPTGTVTFLDDATSIGSATLDSSGAAAFTISSLAVGTHSISASYGGDANNNSSSSSPLLQVVNKAAAAVALNSSANPSLFGQTVNFTVTVTAVAPGAGTPSGTVTFSDGTTTIGTAALGPTGAATFTTSALAPGTHTITAAYGGDGDFNPSSSSPLSQVVNKATATVSLNSSANPSLFGQAVNFTVTVTAVAPGTATATGTVTLQDGAATLGSLTLVNGQASFTTSSLAVGSHSITAAYSGDSNLKSGTSVLTQTVTQNATSLTLSSSANPSVFGQPLVLTATVSVAAPAAATPTGTVTFQDGATSLGSAKLVNGQASLRLSALSVGLHSITATYSGELTSSSAAVAQMVNKASTTTTLSSSANPATLNQSVTFTATVNVVAPGAGTPTGTVIFSDGTTTLTTVALSSAGIATFSTSTLAVKSHSITAAYSGDGNFNRSAGVMTQNVQYSICVQYDQSRSVQSGATFPIKLELCDLAGNNLSASSIVVHATAVVAASGSAGPPQDSGNANPNGDFRFSGGSRQNAGYIFNLRTNGLQTGTYALQFMISGDPVPHSVPFGVQ